MSNVERSRVAWTYYIVVVVGIALLFFASVQTHGIDNHDAETLRDNARISEDFSHFFSPEREQITGRPFADFFKWVFSLVLGQSVGGFHLLVVLMHGFAVLLLARLVEVVHRDRHWAFVGGLLFLVNVTHFQAVHHMSALDYPLALCLVLWALLCYWRYEQSDRTVFLVGTYIAFSAAVLTHMAAAALGPICLYWSWRRGRSPAWLASHVIPLGIVMSALVLFALFSTPNTTSTWASIEYYEESEVSPFNSVRLFAWFNGRLFSTAHWLLFTVYEQHAWEIYVGAVALAGLVGLLMVDARRYGVWVAWIPLSLLPFLFVPEDLIFYLLPEGPSRYLYLATAASSLLIASFLLRICARFGRWAMPVEALVLAAIMCSSYVSLKKVEGFSHYTSGRHHLVINNVDEGVSRLRRAIDEGGDAIPLQDAYERLVLALMVEPEKVEPIVEESLSLFPDSVPINVYRLILESLGSDSVIRGEAEDLIDEIGSIPQAREIIGLGYFNLANGLKHRGQTDRAMAFYERALYFVPDKVGVLRALGKGRVMQGRFEEAIVLIERLIELDRVDYTMRYVLGRLYVMRGDMSGASRVLREVIELAPDSKEADQSRKLLGEL